ncbi:hypothetical protein B0O80DRAFT_425104 [Mortierella sp. GBAus27b]|nr:sphingomyelin synthase [Mortierella sp. GBA43]KAI8357220.1 hypothetical protein B0O80DRAFT_425104 [Mortierella sp. GBAus27b]
MATSKQPDPNMSSIDSLQAAAVSPDTLNRHSDTTVVVDSSDHPAPLEHSPKRSIWDRCINSELGRLVVSVIFFAIVCLGMAFCNQFSDHRWVDTPYRGILLKDRGFDIFPALKDITPANAFVLTSLVFTLVGIGLFCPNWTARIIVIRRFFWVVGTLSIYRALTLSVTTLPTPKENCVPTLEKGFGEMLLIALQMIPGTVQACTDDIFSGHTVFMVTSAIQWRLYCPYKWVTYFAYVYITVGLYFVIATRLHYTVDVVLAIFITYAVWSVYIAMIDVVMEKEYFGLKRHNDKYLVFDHHLSEETQATTTAHDHEVHDHSKREQLKLRLNRMRGPGIGYDRGEHSQVAFVPMQYNVWLTGAVRWCDGLDLRMRQSLDANSRWETLMVERRSRHHSDASSSAPSGPPFAYMKTGQERQPSSAAPAMLDSIHIDESK